MGAKKVRGVRLPWVRSMWIHLVWDMIDWSSFCFYWQTYQPYIEDVQRNDFQIICILILACGALLFMMGLVLAIHAKYRVRTAKGVDVATSEEKKVIEDHTEKMDAASKTFEKAHAILLKTIKEKQKAESKRQELRRDFEFWIGKLQEEAPHDDKYEEAVEESKLKEKENRDAENEYKKQDKEAQEKDLALKTQEKEMQKAKKNIDAIHTKLQNHVKDRLFQQVLKIYTPLQLVYDILQCVVFWKLELNLLEKSFPGKMLVDFFNMGTVFLDLFVLKGPVILQKLGELMMGDPENVVAELKLEE